MNFFLILPALRGLHSVVAFGVLFFPPGSSYSMCYCRTLCPCSFLPPYCRPLTSTSVTAPTGPNRNIPTVLNRLSTRWRALSPLSVRRSQADHWHGNTLDQIVSRVAFPHSRSASYTRHDIRHFDNASLWPISTIIDATA